MKLYKTLPIALILALCISSLGIVNSAFAQEPPELTEDMIAGETTISPRGEVTGYKYMYIDGVLYKRLWSYTGGYWIDPVWTSCD